MTPDCGAKGQHARRELLAAREELTALRANLKTVTDRMEKLTEERLADANALDDAQREIAEDAKATAESQEITGKYMADAERAEALIRQMVEMISKGYVNFSDWVKAVEKYLDLRSKEAELDRVSKERLASANALDAAQREIAAYRQSGVLEALRAAGVQLVKPGCDCESCRIELQRRSSIAALEAMEKLRATTGGLG